MTHWNVLLPDEEQPVEQREQPVSRMTSSPTDDSTEPPSLLTVPQTSTAPFGLGSLPLTPLDTDYYGLDSCREMLDITARGVCVSMKRTRT